MRGRKKTGGMRKMHAAAMAEGGEGHAEYGMAKGPTKPMGGLAKGKGGGKGGKKSSKVRRDTDDM